MNENRLIGVEFGHLRRGADYIAGSTLGSVPVWTAIL